jgi:hypothetical protein
MAYSTFTIQSIIDALADYTKVTGIDLSKNPFAAAIERSHSPETILELLQEREKTFKDYREGYSSFLRDPGRGGQSGEPHWHTIWYYSFNVTSSGPLPASKCVVC